MLVYRAMYRYVGNWVYGEALDFPGAATAGRDLAQAREQLTAVVLGLAKLHRQMGQPLPVPNPQQSDEAADVEEPIYLAEPSETPAETAEEVLR